MTEPIQIETEDGLRLEGVVDEPAEPKAALVLCHPHPQMGGTMNAPLLEAICEHLVGLRWAVLRFNFRGIGASEGEPGIGNEELKDARAAWSAAGERWSSLPRAIGGWSFGAAIALRAAAEGLDPLACFAVAPSVEEKAEISAGLPAPAELAVSFPTLFIVGANDDVTPPERARTWAEAAGVGYKEIKGANHFFWGKYEQLAGEVGAFLEAQL